MQTLEQFVRQHGGPAKAAIVIGIAQTTLWRWLDGRCKPRGLTLRRLRELNIDPNPLSIPDKIAKTIRVRPLNEALAKNDEEMLLGMLTMPASERVADVDKLRVRLWRLSHSGRTAYMEQVVRVSRKMNART
ncbi:MAG: hypothetical protein AABZ44_07550 [Elusimicrobiota bacterium]